MVLLLSLYYSLSIAYLARPVVEGISPTIIVLFALYDIIK